MCTLVTELSLPFLLTQNRLFHMSVVKYPEITPELMHKCHVLGVTLSARLLLSQDALAERRDKPEVSSGLGQRKEGVLMLKLLQVFWLSSP